MRAECSAFGDGLGVVGRIRCSCYFLIRPVDGGLIGGPRRMQGSGRPSREGSPPIGAQHPLLGGSLEEEPRWKEMVNQWATAMNPIVPCVRTFGGESR